MRSPELENQATTPSQEANQYAQDLQSWIQKTITQLRNQEFEALDVEHLIEELEDLGKSDKTSFVSNLKILLAHLLKLKIQQDAPDTMKQSWFNSIDEHRERITDILGDSPSFKNFLNEAIARAYPSARKLAIKEGKRAKFGVRMPPESAYPNQCPFAIAQILDEDFYGT